ncbi:MAG: ATP-binding cassette domain-containing protein [Acidobacteria bacterium]|nr:ATP-binding cassette domain-containing protein [Acidobacteriota bacterium]MCI0621426.1 ATP-binding cassette domain-containing protein [Acidobacteriota bacterium]MCI0724444.1 ATP-binding cassette domain-containing protein [Acidobacteriota bacterium]
MRKAFRSVIAVQDVSFEVHAGEIFGLLGPNGAGKTTLLRLIMDIFRPDSGSIQVFGRHFLKEDKARIGYLPEERGLYTRQKVQAVVEYLVQLKGVPQPQARANTLRWLERLEMLGVKDRKVQELSKGNQQKIQFIATVAADPEILILDEPFSGLDPVNARAMIQVIQELATGGKTIVLSTHQMNLVESLCRRVFMIHQGRQVLYGNLEDIQKAYSENSVIVRSDAGYSHCPWIARAVANGRGTQIVLSDNARPRDLLAWLVETGAEVESFERAKTPLEDIFIKLVQE